MATEVCGLGKVVIITYDDGTGSKLAQALDVPSSSWKLVVYPLAKALQGNDMNEVDVSGELLNFVDSLGATQVSMISLTGQIPTAASAHVAHVIFEFIFSKAPVRDPSFEIIVPAVVTVPGSVHNLLQAPNKLLLAAFINGASESGVLGGFPRLPSTTRIQEEFLAVLLHFVHVMMFPTVLLLAPKRQRLPSSKSDTSEVINQFGSTLAKQLGLKFSEQIAATNGTDTLKKASGLDDWRSLYT